MIAPRLGMVRLDHRREFGTIVPLPPPPPPPTLPAMSFPGRSGGGSRVSRAARENRSDATAAATNQGIPRPRPGSRRRGPARTRTARSVDERDPAPADQNEQRGRKTGQPRATDVEPGT